MSSRSQNIIQRRDLEPLLLKAREIVKHYEKAAECMVTVLEPELSRAVLEESSAAVCFCVLCGRFNDQECSCNAMHRNSVQEARRLGGSYIYLCPMGFIFWTSPIYSGERFAGALLSGGVLSSSQRPAGADRRQAAEDMFRSRGEEVSQKEIDGCLESIPEKTDEEIKALAQMMLICAEQISAGDALLPFKDMPLLQGDQPFPGGAWAGEELSRREARGSLAEYSGAEEAGENSYPMDKERMLLASLRRGDNAEARQILKEMLDILAVSSGGNFEIFQLRAIELTVMLSRAAADPADSGDANQLETNNRYLQKIEDARSQAAIYEILNIIIERISGKIFSFQGIRHSSALRRAERFIWENYTRKISLQEIATASGLSAPYFSTIFKDEMGENLSNYLNRLRVEKATAMLAETDLPISGIAAACGFEDQSWFSKIFKNHTGLSPGKYREQGGLYSPADYN